MALIPPPVIDLTSPTVAVELADACAQCGFFFIRNHGVDAAVIDSAWSAVRSFFDAPLEVKEAVAMSASYPYGYGGMNTEKTGHKGGAGAYDTSDLKESFQVCLSSADKPAPNLPVVQWPREPAGLETALTRYYRAMEALAARLLLIFADAACVPPDYFASRSDSHWCALRALNYPEQSTPPNPGQLRIAPHSDYGVLTILRADDAPGGLEVLRSDGSWTPVVIPADCFVVNLGDLMQRWTNDAWRSTVHRVVNPPTAPGVPTRRQSMAFFHNLNRDVEVSCIPSFLKEGEAPKYAPINAFDHLMQRHALSMGHAVPQTA